MLAAVLIVALIEAVVAQIVEIGVVLVVIVFSFGFTFFFFRHQDSQMEVHWSKALYKRFGKYEEGTLQHLVKKYDRQPTKYTNNQGYLDPEITTPLLKKGNSVIITLWDSASEEISEELIHSCDIHSFIDDAIMFNYG